MEINIDIDRNRERRRLRPRQLYSYSLLPPLQALREGGVEGVVEGLAPTERRLPLRSAWLGSVVTIEMRLELVELEIEIEIEVKMRFG